MSLDSKRRFLRQAIESRVAVCKCSEKIGILSAESIVTLREKLTDAHMIKIHELEKLKPSPMVVECGKPKCDPFRIFPTERQVQAMPRRLLFCARYKSNMTIPYAHGALNCKLYKK